MPSDKKTHIAENKSEPKEKVEYTLVKDAVSDIIYSEQREGVILTIHIEDEDTFKSLNGILRGVEEFEIHMMGKEPTGNEECNVGEMKDGEQVEWFGHLSFMVASKGNIPTIRKDMEDLANAPEGERADE